MRISYDARGLAEPVAQAPRVATVESGENGLVAVFDAAELTTRHPDAVVLFLADLRAEVSAAYPEIEAGGGHWVDADSLGS